MRTSQRIAGIVLAAGESRRFGSPKAMLPAGPDGETFVGRAVRILAEGGASPVLVVGRPNDYALRSMVAGLTTAALCVENPTPERGQLSSLLVGLQAVEPARVAGIAVVPVDMPAIRADTVGTAISAFRHLNPPVLRVTHGARHGHPVIFAARLFEDLRRADPAIGAKAVVRACGEQVVNLEVDDPGVLRDVDFVEDYRALFGRDPP
jgi:molybdenum cofactor cytidylyltransferase